jgi:hypothetical protein
VLAEHPEMPATVIAERVEWMGSIPARAFRSGPRAEPSPAGVAPPRRKAPDESGQQQRVPRRASSRGYHASRDHPLAPAHVHDDGGARRHPLGGRRGVSGTVRRTSLASTRTSWSNPLGGCNPRSVLVSRVELIPAVTAACSARRPRAEKSMDASSAHIRAHISVVRCDATCRE